MATWFALKELCIIDGVASMLEAMKKMQSIYHKWMYQNWYVTEMGEPEMIDCTRNVFCNCTRNV